jgi:exosortase J
LIGVVVVMLAGSSVVFPAWMQLRALWASDPLRSIAAWFPLLSLLGILRAWREEQWALQGTAWGLVPIVISAPLAQFLVVFRPRFSLHGHEIASAEMGLAIFLYAAGAVVLFGGVRLLRAALAPLCLLLLLNPVPHLYNLLVDLPLQEFSANTARAFAHLIGLHPSGEQLRMIFAPNFGMMIVPGCNGVRGSVTLAYLALIFGYAIRVRPRRLVMVTALGFAAGFALNLLRLCVLVVYYRVGLALPSLQRHGAGADYAIGGTLFLVATLAFGYWLRTLAPAAIEPAAASAPLQPASARQVRATLLRAVCLLLLALAAHTVQARQPAETNLAPLTLANAVKLLPPQVGPYQLQRSYGEQQSGVLMMVLGDYSTAPSGSLPPQRLTLGFYLLTSDHMVVGSKRVQGLYPVWTGSLTAESLSQSPMVLAVSFFDDGALRQEIAESICSMQRCFATISGQGPLGLKMNVGSATDLTLGPGKRIPIFLRREWPDSDPRSSDQLRSAFAQDARLFLANVDLQRPVESAGHRP